ncbi:MAG: glutathione synthase [Hyphomonadaceae bacterium]|nr:MAG: glutathione synthase [Hyphomonadaceae bacterium]KAF0184906.1 MAG: glutathione synthase [Hyphomonadaceae bacterium]
MTQNLRVAFQMDPIEGINIAADTSFAMMEQAQARGHELWIFQPQHVAWEEGEITAKARPIKVKREIGNHYDMGAVETINLSNDIDIIHMRQDPPFDMSYISAAHMLEFVTDRTLVVNDPFWVRNSPEKIIPLMFPELMPPTLVTRNRDAIMAFKAKHEDIVVKPLFGNAGAAVFRIKPDDGNLGSLIDLFFATSNEPLMVQAFVKEVFQGDKRIFLIDGKPMGGINRIPKGDDIRSNLAAGGSAEACELSERDLEICAAIGPTLRERNLLFVGIDVIAGRLTEINVTSPTGIRAFWGFTGIDLMVPFWDAVEAKFHKRDGE